MGEVIRCIACGASELTQADGYHTFRCARCGCVWSPAINTDGTGVDAPVAARYNSGKTEYHLVPREPVDAIAEVLNYGATKYAARNWEKGGPLKVPYNSFERHRLAWLSGEDNDAESGLPHLSHMIANLAFLVTYTRRGIGEDFRPTQKPKVSSVPVKIFNAFCHDKEVPGERQRGLSPAAHSDGR